MGALIRALVVLKVLRIAMFYRVSRPEPTYQAAAEEPRRNPLSLPLIMIPMPMQCSSFPNGLNKSSCQEDVNVE